MELWNTPGGRVETVNGATDPERTKELFESATKIARQDQVRDNCDLFKPRENTSEVNVNAEDKNVPLNGLRSEQVRKVIIGH